MGVPLRGRTLKSVGKHSLATPALVDLEYALYPLPVFLFVLASCGFPLPIHLSLLVLTTQNCLLA